MRHGVKEVRRKKGKPLGPLRPLLIIDPLPESLLLDVMRRWPEGRMSRRKVETYIRHEYSNYDEVRYALCHQRYDELRDVCEEKVRAAFDEWLRAHPGMADRLST